MGTYPLTCLPDISTCTPIERLLLENLEIIRMLKSRSTYNGRKRATEHLFAALKHAGVATLEELNHDRQRCAMMVQHLGDLVEEGELGQSHGTVEQRLSQVFVSLKEIGLSEPRMTLFRHAKSRLAGRSPNGPTTPQCLSEAQVRHLIQIVEELPERTDFVVKGFVAGPLRRARLRLRVLLAAGYSLRAASIHGMKRGDITPDGLAYTVQKGGHSGQTINRSMHSTIWRAYVDLLRELPEDDDHLFRDTSWLYRGVRTIMAEAGIPLQSNRLGTHVFRRVWVEWCESNDVGIEIASQGLNHVDSQVTERVYRDVIKGQMRASAAMARYAEDVLNSSSLQAETMRELSELNSLLSHVFAYGLPSGQENDPHSVAWNHDASAEDGWWVRPDLNWGLAPPKRQV